MTTLSSTPSKGAAPGRERLAGLRAYLDGLQGRPRVEELLAELKKASVTIDDVRSHVRFSDERYSRNLMWEGEHYEALVICWKVKQHSQIHDHAGSVCGLTILQGQATETIYKPTPCGVMKPTISSVNGVGTYCASEDSDTHQVSNYEAETDLVTLHIYAPKLNQVGIYGHDGEKHEDLLSRFTGFIDGGGI